MIENDRERERERKWVEINNLNIHKEGVSELLKK
jgi:hypothetical protein